MLWGALAIVRRNFCCCSGRERGKRGGSRGRARGRARTRDGDSGVELGYVDEEGSRGTGRYRDGEGEGEGEDWWVEDEDIDVEDFESRGEVERERYQDIV